MAGIVASTLRRKAFHRGTRGSEQSKAAMAAAAAAAAAMATDTNAASYSPTASRRSSRSSSFAGCRPDDADDRSAPATHAGQVALTPYSTAAKLPLLVQYNQYQSSLWRLLGEILLISNLADKQAQERSGIYTVSGEREPKYVCNISYKTRAILMILGT